MDLLGGYGSDSGEEDAGQATQGSSASKPAAPKKKVINYAKLPVSRPLSLDTLKEAKPKAVEEEPTLKQSAALDNGRFAEGRGLLSALPPPKVVTSDERTPQLGSGGAGRIDLSSLKPKKPETEGSGNGSPVNAARTTIPASELAARIFGTTEKADVEGPTEVDLEQLKRAKKFTDIQADDMKDPDWYMQNQINGFPGLKGKKVAPEVSMYDEQKWAGTTHANPSKIQKRKHQINWLASEAIDKEAEMLDRSASTRQTKAQTMMKYGW